MKIKVGDLRRIIREEYMRGVPEFQLQEATRKYVDEIRRHVRHHIEQTRGSGPVAIDAYEKSEEMLKQLEEEANQLLEDKIWQFIQRV